MDYHDVLARMGVANAHPGGQDATDFWLSQINLHEHTSVLDVGCGNGATACEMARKWNCDVTAIDIRPRMVKNTKKRALQQGLSVQALQASAEALPFTDHTFDFIACESVLVFVDNERALREFFRVLKPGGQMVDVEMLLLRPVTKAWKDEVKRIYGALEVPDLGTWKRKFQAVGFSPIRVLRSGPIDALTASGNQSDNSFVDASALSDPKVLRIVEENGHWLQANQRIMGYGIFLLTKHH
ncbi:class I SAM-dependent methyltransferase [Alicyclobacillus fodiniaquatilis]|uniref:Class I SAM-dependent methyltransferase n=1 Tax=Alicyclobacillus fodiniaquatilis TaxID=1661150 RepID=A0ABW4JFR8_9BACL